MLKPFTAQNIEFDFWHTTTFASRGLLIAFLLSFVCLPGGQGIGAPPERPGTGLPTTVEHDIAPWDGPAFGIWIPAEPFGGKIDSWIYLRIWDAPERSQKKFVFPDESVPRSLGAVVYFMDLKSPSSVNWRSQPRHELKGSVRFIKSNRVQPVVGEFDFVSEKGTALKGRFEAQWISKSRIDENVQKSDTTNSR